MILITGSTGFIGAAIMRTFGSEAIGLQRKVAPDKPGVLECDLTNKAQTNAVISKLKGKQITHFIHAAAVTPWSGEVDFSRDLTMAESVENICSSLDIPNLIVLSGWNVYDMQGEAPFSEATPISPIGEYGTSKFAIEDYFRTSMSDRVLNLRLASVYGEGQISAGLIPNLVSSALANGEMTLQGVSTKRDYLYIDDLLEVLNTLVTMEKMPLGDLNIGSGQSVSVVNIAEAIKTILKNEHHREVKIVTSDTPQESIPIDNQLDITAAKKNGLLVRVTPIEQGLARFIQWRLDENIL